MSIRLLDPETIGQIAAGEVIERPVSVVKELVENAIDGGATRISVRVRSGGLAEIEVADDGEGIPAEDVPRAPLRHATSKLVDASGLRAIFTLGFRGEGLASIVAVARTTIASRTADAEIATAVEAFGEAIGDPYPVAGPTGTRVVVRDLFANVPARREFLRGPGAEFARIVQWLATMGLAYPQVAFTLEHDGRAVCAFAGDGDPFPRLAHVFGRGASAMLPFTASSSDGEIAVQGWISAPGDDRPDRRGQIAFVNRRLVRANQFSGAWAAAYRTFAMSGRHPYGLILAEIAPAAVDPNVHPTKSEVRLRYGERANAVVRAAMGDALGAAARVRLGRAISPLPVSAAEAGDAAPVAWSGALVAEADAAAPALQVLGQIDRTYILATDGAAIVLVDQHAAHERIVYEELLENAAAPHPGEPLLVPLTFEVRPDEARALEGAREALAAAGLVVEPFGERAYRVVATPAHTTHAGKTRTFAVADFLDCLADDAPQLDALHRVLASLACHSVTRSGEPLQPAEMTILLERLGRCANPMHCPHGRPTIVRLEPEAIGRLFKRL